jgi:hypothetical protein
VGGREAGYEVKNEIKAKKGFSCENEQEICEMKRNNRSETKKNQKMAEPKKSGIRVRKKQDLRSGKNIPVPLRICLDPVRGQGSL